MAKVRSPNYPVISLPAAIEKARLVFNKEHTHKADQEVIAKAMGYSSLNGASMSVVSALRKYGLLEEADGGLRISKEAVVILVDPKDSKDRATAIKRAAFSPALFEELQKEYGATLPSDENISALLIKRGFSPTTVSAPIKAYRETITLVDEIEKIYPAEKLKDVPPPESKLVTNGEANADKVDIGDLIQWEIDGIFQLETPRRVRAIQQHEGADWVFVEGSEAGIPMNQTVLEQKVTSPKAAPPTLPLPETIVESRAANSGSEREWLRGPLSKGVSYRLIVSGDLGPKEIGKLIKLLEAQKAVLDDDYEEK
ncbi:MAG: hypothetical protein WA797_00620 [Acidimicrobiales bacterium]